MIETVKDINISLPEGKMLIAALALLAAEPYGYNTDEVIERCKELSRNLFPESKIHETAY